MAKKWGILVKKESGSLAFTDLEIPRDYRCAKEGAQFFIVTHSPILLGIPGAEIYCFDNGRIHLCEYEETESYQVTEMFINNRKALLGRLLGGLGE